MNPVLIQNIPIELTERPQWVCWEYQTHGPKQTKVPLDPNTRLPGNVSDPSSLTTFEVARRVMEENAGRYGIGFVFSKDDPYVGIDIDRCVNGDGTFTPEAMDAFRCFGGSYFETSPSGTGLKFWVRGKLPTSSTGRKNSKLGVEAYHHGRFFTVTGAIRTTTANSVIDCSQSLIEWYAAKFPAPDGAHSSGLSEGLIECPRSADDLISTAVLTNPRLMKLFEGDFANDYPSQSEADLAFCVLLARETGPDPVRIDEIFRRSGLYRSEKWERQKYRNGTIQKAIRTELQRRNDVLAPYRDILKQAAKFQPPAGTTMISLQSSVSSGIVSQWMTPVDLFTSVQPEPMTSRDFPSTIEPMISAVAAHTETPFELSGLLALGVLATACQKKFIVQLPNGHFEPLALWVCPSMDPGNRKTAVINLLTQPFKQWQTDKLRSLADTIGEQKQTILGIEKRIDHLQNKACKEDDPNNRSALQREIADLTKSIPVAVRSPELFTTDCTPEKLAALMQQNDERISLISDEAGVFSMMGGRYSKGIPNLDVYLQGHAGSSVRVHRNSSDTIHLDSPCLTIAISPQPIVIQQAAQSDDFNGRGLLDRFLYSIPVSNLGSRTLDSPPIPEQTSTGWNQLICTILDIPLSRNETGTVISHALRLSDVALRLWKEEQLATEREMAPGELWSDRTGWASKYPAAVLRIAGIFHIAETVEMGFPPEECPIRRETMQSAIGLGRKIKSHSAYAFGFMRASPVQRLSEKILAWIKRESLQGFTAREAYRAVNSGKLNDTMRDALKTLEDHHWIRPAKIALAVGRPTEQYEVNPAALSAPQDVRCQN